MIDTTIKQYTYKDLVIMPSVVSNIYSRKICNPYYEDGYLPLFTAPMNMVVDAKNFQLFEINKIHSIIPRTEPLNFRLNQSLQTFSSFSLSEFEEYFVKEKIEGGKRYVLIDIANGHMIKLYELVKKAKINYGDNIVIMIGNIANPLTYIEAINSNVDYVRVSIGGGFGCLTSTSVGVHYAPASLLDEINKIKLLKKEEGITTLPKVIADGGIRDYSDIIKALALGADYVMCGYVFAKMLESASEDIIDIPNEDYDEFIESSNKCDFLLPNKNEKLKKYIKENRIKKRFYGMSTKAAQTLMKKATLNTSEGVERFINVEYTMEGWIDNFISYLRSAMSYCDSRTLDDFIGKQTLLPITSSTFQLFNK